MTDQPQSSDPKSWVDQYGEYLFRYALARTRDPQVAEDLVQEAFMAALQARDGFMGRSSERTWLVGILKHKILDYFRKTSRESHSDLADNMTPTLEDMFDNQGNWKPSAIGPKDWGEDPNQILERKEFWDVLAHCVGELPSRHARAFSLREIDDLNSEEVCKVLNVSTTNLWVMLHRARSHLRRCLEIHFLGRKT